MAAGGCSEVTVRFAGVTAEDQSWKHEQSRLGALFLLQQELSAGFWGQGSSGAPQTLGRRCPNQGPATTGGTKSMQLFPLLLPGNQSQPQLSLDSVFQIY